MKKQFLKFIAVAVIILATAVSCTEETISVKKVLLTPTPLLLGVDVSATLEAIVLPLDATNKTVYWTSSDESVATVDHGIVTAKALGKAYITVITEDGDHKATCEVTVIHLPIIEMAMVEGGTFTMGCTDGTNGQYPDELPTHQVTLSSFQIGKYTVTINEWVTLMGYNPNYLDEGNMPVRVCWNDIQIFINKLNRATGKNYRLPTEAEWEFAARGGVKSEKYQYSGSNNIDEVAWYQNNSNWQVHPVGTKSHNELDIYDMSGNVWEWCSDWYGSYTAEAQISPTGPNYGECKVYRGGCCTVDAWDCRISKRANNYPDTWARDYTGFRLVLPVE
jgi:hypothetical protein